MDTCDMRVGDVSVNIEEGCRELRLRDVLEKMEHQRELIIGIIFREGSGNQIKMLSPEFDNSLNKEKSRENITLDMCMNAFNQEELLSGAD